MQGAEHHNIIAPLFFMFRYSVPAFRMIKIATNVLRLCRFWHEVNAYAHVRETHSPEWIYSGRQEYDYKGGKIAPAFRLG